MRRLYYVPHVWTVYRALTPTLDRANDECAQLTFGVQIKNHWKGNVLLMCHVYMLCLRKRYFSSPKSAKTFYGQVWKKQRLGSCLPGTTHHQWRLEGTSCSNIFMNIFPIATFSSSLRNQEEPASSRVALVSIAE